MTYVRTDHDAESIKRSYQQVVSNIRQCLDSLTESARQFNCRLEKLVTTAIKERKDRLLADAGMLAAIGLPLRKREGMPITWCVPMASVTAGCSMRTGKRQTGLALRLSKF